MRTKTRNTARALAGLALVLLAGRASALSCTDETNVFTVDPATACAPNPQVNPDNDNFPTGNAIPDTLVFQPGGITLDWTGVDKDPGDGLDAALGLTANGANLAGSFTVNTAGLDYQFYALFLKGGNDSAAFILDMSQAINGVLTGTWSITAPVGQTSPPNGLSHMSLYGTGTGGCCENDVPEPGSLALLGLGLLGLGLTRRRKI